jgi:hypothetical protein
MLALVGYANRTRWAFDDSNAMTAFEGVEHGSVGK